MSLYNICSSFHLSSRPNYPFGITWIESPQDGEAETASRDDDRTWPTVTRSDPERGSVLGLLLGRREAPSGIWPSRVVRALPAAGAREDDGMSVICGMRRRLHEAYFPAHGASPAETLQPFAAAGRSTLFRPLPAIAEHSDAMHETGVPDDAAGGGRWVDLGGSDAAIASSAQAPARDAQPD